ncbi:MAG: N-acetylglucosamine-6-phosphate deacetylase [Mucilaginibacter sp.]|nr:N-acetylglucosamine-6-phosphate deacetylase [Mucilaginibacter sp.]
MRCRTNQCITNLAQAYNKPSIFEHVAKETGEGRTGSRQSSKLNGRIALIFNRTWIMTSAIFASKVFDGQTILENQLIRAEAGKILSITPMATPLDVKAVDFLAAGFIDLQVNGGNEAFFTQKPAITSVADIDSSCAALGTAWTLPTFITSPFANILQGITALRDFQSRFPGSGVLGMHLEGPYINPEKRGGHPREYVQKPTNDELRELIDQGRGIIKLMTIAPEVFTPDQIAMLIEAGITISLGHSNASYSQAKAAFGMGIRLVTHLYNAMSLFVPKSPGVVGAVFDDPDVYAPIILDGLHCDFAAARIAWKLKKDKFFLISDAMFTGRVMKKFQWHGIDIILENGTYRNSEGNLNGAAISLGDAVRNAVEKVGIPLHEAVEMVTIRPARAIGLDHLAGKVAVGYPARFTVFDQDLQSFEVIRMD